MASSIRVGLALRILSKTDAACGQSTRKLLTSKSSRSAMKHSRRHFPPFATSSAAFATYLPLRKAENYYNPYDIADTPEEAAELEPPVRYYKDTRFDEPDYDMPKTKVRFGKSSRGFISFLSFILCISIICSLLLHFFFFSTCQPRHTNTIPCITPTQLQLIFPLPPQVRALYAAHQPADLFTNFEVSRDPVEWSYVERLLAPAVVPPPPPHPHYPTPSGWSPPNPDPSLTWKVMRKKDHHYDITVDGLWKTKAGAPGAFQVRKIY